MEDNQQNKREFTKKLVSNLKDKISEFKNRKAHEKIERKDELDFEINKDLVNQFKKNKNTNLNSIEETKISVNTPLKTKPKTQDIQQIQQEVTSNKANPSIISRQQETLQLNQKESALSPSENLESLKKNNVDLKKQEMMTSLLNKMNNPNANNYNLNNTNKGNNCNSALMNNNADAYLIPIKKDIPKGIVKYPISFSGIHQNNVPVSPKTKMRNLMEQIDEPRRIMSSKDNSYKLIPLPTYTGPTHVKHSNTNLTKKNIDKKKDIFSIESFGDFNYKSHNNSSIINNINSIDKSKGLNLNINSSASNHMIEPIYKASIPTKSECPIKVSEVRAIANKIRFLSGEDAKGMDKNVIDELSNLKDVVNRLFESKLKVKDYKY